MQDFFVRGFVRKSYNKMPLKHKCLLGEKKMKPLRFYEYLKMCEFEVLLNRSKCWVNYRLVLNDSLEKFVNVMGMVFFLLFIGDKDLG